MACRRASQDHSSPDEVVYNPPVDLRKIILDQKRAIRRRTQQVLELVRPEQMSWRPVAGALTIGEMLRHLWVSEEGVRRVALEGDFRYYLVRVPQGLRAVLGQPGTLEEERRELERVHQETLQLVSTYPLERLGEERSEPSLGYRRKVYAILLGINEHEVHHRAQLMTYLRMLGTPVPEPMGSR